MRGALRGLSTFAVVASGAAGATGCAVQPPIGATPGDASAGVPMPAPGFGRLTLDQLSFELDSAGLRVRIAPLSERVIRAAAPDTYTQLHALQLRVVPEDSDPARTQGLYLVTVSAREPGRAFLPGSIRASVGARRFTPERTVPISPGWSARVVGGGMTESAIFEFERGMGMERDLVFHYGEIGTRPWGSIQPTIEAELVRARARGGGHQSSNFRIFR